MTGMCPYERNDEDISVRTDAYYEQQASHEEIYLEEREEEVLMILEYEVPPPARVSIKNESRQLKRSSREILMILRLARAPWRKCLTKTHQGFSQSRAS
jgi:hypothetical protein